MLDYISTGLLDPDQVEVLVGGVAEGCRQAGCALLGGELAQHPGEMAPGTFDMAGFAVGVVEREARIGPDRVGVGDVLVALPSPGLRSNGFSLVRNVLLERAGMALEDPAWPGADSTLADELLRPSVIYAPTVLAAVRTGFVHAAAHITGGGLPGNLVRAMPDGCEAVVDRSVVAEPRIFDEIRRIGPVDEDEMERVFNLGIGMVLVVSSGGVDDVLAACSATVPTGGGLPVVVGTVEAGDRGVRISRRR